MTHPRTTALRRISLSIGPATATHCGPGLDLEGGIRCPRLRTGEEMWHCVAFGVSMEYNEDRSYPERRPECIALELPSPPAAGG